MAQKGMHVCLYVHCTELSAALGKHVLQNQYDLTGYKFCTCCMKQMDILKKVGHKD